MAALVNDSTGLVSLPQFIDCDTRERESEKWREVEEEGEILYTYMEKIRKK